MTTPPSDPATAAPGLSTSLTEPVPTFQPGFAPPEPEPAGRPASQKRGSSGSSRILNLALGAAVLVAVAGVSFAVGRATAPASATVGSGTVFVPGQGGVFVPGDNGGDLPDMSFDPNGNGGFPGGGQGRGLPGDRGFGAFGGGLTMTGTVDSISADSITIKLESGQTITVGLDASTTYHQQADAAASDVTTGDTVQLQLAGRLRPGQGNSSGNAATLGTAGSVTIVP